MNTTAWPEGIKKTKQREAIWSVLTTTDKPITALEIAERLGNGSTTWMPYLFDICIDKNSWFPLGGTVER